MRIAQFLSIFLGLLALIAGCEVDVVPVQSATVVEDDILFIEDADPANAALAFTSGELLVQSLPGASDADLANLFASAGVAVTSTLEEISVSVLQVDPSSFHGAATTLADSGLIEAVQKNYLYEPSAIPSDAFYDQQGYLEEVGIDHAWDLSADVAGRIAIVDTGVDSSHPDLSEKVVGGWNTVNATNSYIDRAGHGTMVAGIAAAASDNRIGIAGVAWNSDVLAVRVTDEEGRVSASDIAAGILWASQNGARVINVSFAPLWSNRIVRSAAQQAFHRGGLVVISAGNEGGTWESPGFPEAIFVGATSSAGAIARFSDQGPFVDLAAPGVGIWSTRLDGGYGSASGSSFAAPIVSGVIALAWSVNPELRPITIQNILYESALDEGPRGKDQAYGHGVLDAASAVRSALATTYTRDTRPPSVSVVRPIRGSVLSRRTAAIVYASDRWGVADVVMYVDGIAQSTDTRAPYRFLIDPKAYTAGQHQISFVATDTSGNQSDPRSVTVTFRSPIGSADDRSGSVRISSPANGSSVFGSTTIRATVSDVDGLSTIEWFLDGSPVFATAVSGTSSGVSYLWRAADASLGMHTISLVLTDRLGNRTTGQVELHRR